MFAVYLLPLLAANARLLCRRMLPEDGPKASSESRSPFHPAKKRGGWGLCFCRKSLLLLDVMNFEAVEQMQERTSNTNKILVKDLRPATFAASMLFV